MTKATIDAILFKNENLAKQMLDEIEDQENKGSSVYLVRGSDNMNILQEALIFYIDYYGMF